MSRSYQLTTADWKEALRLLTLSADELHAMKLTELRGGSNLLRTIGELCSQRSLALRNFAEARERIGAVD
jgi:hypothetical protein